MFNHFKKKKPDSEEKPEISDKEISPKDPKNNEDESEKDETNSNSEGSEVSQSQHSNKEHSYSSHDYASNQDSQDKSKSEGSNEESDASKQPADNDKNKSDLEVDKSTSSTESGVQKSSILPRGLGTSFATETESPAVEFAPTGFDGGSAGGEYTFDQAIEACAYGKFQSLLTVLVGICWFADAFEVLVLSFLDGYIACDWNIHMWQAALMTSSFFLGMMVGGPIFGIVADNYGRRTTIRVSMGLCFILGVLSGLAPSWGYLLATRILVGVTLGSLAQGVTLCIEYYPVKFRGISGFYINYYWSFGNLFLAIFCWMIMQNSDMWRWTLSLVSLPALGVCILTWWYPESVRFYLVTHQYDKAVAQVDKLAHVNDSTLPPGKLQQLIDQESKGSILDLLKPPHTATTLLFWYIWFAIAFHYYGLAFMTPLIIKQGKVVLSSEKAANVFGNANSTAEFFTSLLPCTHLTSQNFLDLMWTGAAEVPGMWIYSLMVQHFTRKKLLTFALIVNAVGILLFLVNFPGSVIEKVLMFCLRGNSGGFFQLVMTMTGEAFPTTLRAISMGSSHAFSMLGAAIVPFAAQVLVIDHPTLSVCIMSGVIVVAAVGAALLPREMMNVTIKDFSEGYKEVEIETASVLSVRSLD